MVGFLRSPTRVISLDSDLENSDLESGDLESGDEIFWRCDTMPR